MKFIGHPPAAHLFVLAFIVAASLAGLVVQFFAWPTLAFPVCAVIAMVGGMTVQRLWP